MAIFKNTPPIVTDGLVLAVDAANPKSYISGSITWTNLITTVNGTLVSGPTYSTTYGGGITCDGIDDSINFNNDIVTQFPATSSWSFIITTELLSQNLPYPSILSKGNSTTSGILVFYYSSGSVIFKHNNVQLNPITVPMNKPFQYVVTYSGTGSVKIYLNGVYKVTGSPIVSTDTGSFLAIGSGDSYANIRTYNFLKYNKELTPQEVLQNYNALKTRFNLT